MALSNGDTAADSSDHVANGHVAGGINGGVARQKEDYADGHLEANSDRHRKSAWRNTIEDFGAIWFVIPMNTGILGILYFNQPYTFSGLKVISTIMYILAMLLFAVFSILTIVRWTWFRKAAISKTQGKIDEVAMLAAPVIAWLEITVLTALIVSNAYWGHHAFSLVAYVMWWFGAAWMVVTCIGVCVDIFTHDIVHDRTMSTTLFIPAVGVATASVAGAIVCGDSYHLSPSLAVPVLITCLLLTGLAIFISLELYTIYFHRLLTMGWPEGPKLPSLILLVSSDSGGTKLSTG